MSVRKRTWQNRDGSNGEAWIVNYTDQAGTRRLKTFERKKDADASRPSSASTCAGASTSRIARAS